MKNKKNSKRLVALMLVLACVFMQATVLAQSEKKKVSLKDSLDNKLDLSDYLIDANGFIPVPIIITEPALGGFGAGLVPVFIKRRPPYVDTINGKRVVTPVAPDITGGIALYTANKSWLTAAFRSGTFVKSHIKYRFGGGYSNINISFYRTIPQLGEKAFEFNIKTLPVLVQMIKRLSTSHWYAGFKYLFLKSELKYVGDPLLPPQFVKEREYESIVSRLGAIIELDNRDNVFTPDNGIKLHVDYAVSDNVLGSDYDYSDMSIYSFMYKKISQKLVGGLRIDGQQAFNDPPFYLLPYMNMRGLPTARYQGNISLLTEGEVRWDVVPRWSVMLFGGTGKAFNEWSDFESTNFVSTIGTGFRYLLARKFKLRAGIDIAKGPEQWAYYIVFGSNWLK